MKIKDFFDVKEIPVTEQKDALENDIFLIKKEDLIKVVNHLKNDRFLNFEMLLSITGLDSIEFFTVLYTFYSCKNNKTVIIKLILDKTNPCVESLSEIYPSANWHERECFDLLGIEFSNHPNLERILLPSDWIGFPLRKDYTQEDERLSWNKR